MTMEHGAPVEATAWLPGGSLLATAGGTEMKCAAACSQDMLCTCIMQHLYWHSCPYALGIPYMLPSGPKPLAVAIFFLEKLGVCQSLQQAHLSYASYTVHLVPLPHNSFHWYKF